MGIKFRLTQNIVVGYELGLKTLLIILMILVPYVDQATLLAERGPKAVELAYRRRKTGATYRLMAPLERTKIQGWYYFSGISSVLE